MVRCVVCEQTIVDLDGYLTVCSARLDDDRVEVVTEAYDSCCTSRWYAVRHKTLPSAVQISVHLADRVLLMLMQVIRRCIVGEMHSRRFPTLFHREFS